MIKKQFSFGRDMRIASVVQKYIAEILRDFYADDKLISGVSVVETKTGPGAQFVWVYYYLPESADKAKVQKRLDEMKTKIRFELAQRINQKYVPDLQFKYDDTLERAEKIDDLLKHAKEDF